MRTVRQVRTVAGEVIYVTDDRPADGRVKCRVWTSDLRFIGYLASKDG